jgi:hypothetical protein
MSNLRSLTGPIWFWFNNSRADIPPDREARMVVRCSLICRQFRAAAVFVAMTSVGALSCGIVHAQGGRGLLDDIPTPPAAVVVTPPNESGQARPAPPGPPLQIRPPLSQAGDPGAASPTPNSPPAVLEVRPPPSPSASLLAPSSVVFGAELWDQVYAYGLLWRPSDPARIVTSVRQMLQRKDQVGTCLRAQKEGFRSEDGLIQVMVDDFRNGFPGAVKRTVVGENRYTVKLNAVASISTAHMPRSCGAPRPLDDFIYSVRTTSTFTFEAAEAEVAKLKDQSVKTWRMPTPLEGLAVATALYFDGERGSFSFWTGHDRGGYPTVIAFGRGGLEVDLQTVKSAKSDRAYLVLVQ